VEKSTGTKLRVSRAVQSRLSAVEPFRHQGVQGRVINKLGFVVPAHGHLVAVHSDDIFCNFNVFFVGDVETADPEESVFGKRFTAPSGLNTPLMETSTPSGYYSAPISRLMNGLELKKKCLGR
jgi:hypothetical protein